MFFEPGFCKGFSFSCVAQLNCWKYLASNAKCTLENEK